MLVMAVFGVNVVQRIRQVTHKDHRHLWQILYERTGLLLDVAIFVLQVSSKYKVSFFLFPPFFSLALYLCCLHVRLHL